MAARDRLKSPVMSRPRPLTLAIASVLLIMVLSSACNRASPEPAVAPGADEPVATPSIAAGVGIDAAAIVAAEDRDAADR